MNLIKIKTILLFIFSLPGRFKSWTAPRWNSSLWNLNRDGSLPFIQRDQSLRHTQKLRRYNLYLAILGSPACVFFLKAVCRIQTGQWLLRIVPFALPPNALVRFRSLLLPRRYMPLFLSSASRSGVPLNFVVTFLGLMLFLTPVSAGRGRSVRSRTSPLAPPVSQRHRQVL